MYDQLLEEDPWVQERVARGKAEGKGEATRQNIELVVRTRFPTLKALVLDRVERMQDLEALQNLLIAMSTAQNESKARRYLLALQDEQ